MEQKRILLTGASGFLGKRIRRVYSEKGCLVIAPGHSEMDITDEESVHRVFEEHQPDSVIHCAAVSDTGTCENDPELSRRVNIRGSEIVAGAAYRAGAKCLLCSSDQVYFGSGRAEAHVEEEILSPANVYGRHKLYLEKSCLEKNPDCVLLRLTWMYDPVTEQGEERNDLMRTLLSQLGGKMKMSYPVYDKRGVTYVYEVVRNLEKAFTLPGGVYNFGAENKASLYDTVEELLRRTGHGEELRYLIRDEDRFSEKPRNMSMDIEKIRRYGIEFSSTVDGLVQQMYRSTQRKA